MEEKVVKKPKRSKANIILVIAFIGYTIIDIYISPKDGSLPLWYQLFNISWYLICVIAGYFDGRSMQYYDTLEISETFKNEEEVKEYYINSKEATKNNKIMIVSLILTIIFIATTVILTVMKVKGTLAIIATICEFASVITAIFFALGLGLKSGTLKALKSKIK